MGESGAMEPELQRIEVVRAQHEGALLQIEGVVAVSIGLSADGCPCLKIGTSKSVEEVRAKLPEGLSEIDVEVEYIGDVRAQ